jgi:Fis family transcriptional regulator
MTTKVKTAKATKSIKPKPLRESANDSIQSFLNTLDGETCQDLYAMVIAQVEEPLLAAVMDYTRGNQSKASEMLGLNRGTLRKKLREHKLL